MALEVTAIVDGHHVATHRAAEQRIEELTDLAREHGLGRWVFEVVTGTNIKALLPYFRDAMSGDVHAASELPNGVLTIDRQAEGEPSAAAVVWSSSGPVSLQPLDHDLARATAENEEKLASANGFQRHLAVDVQALRARISRARLCPSYQRASTTSG